MMAGVGCSSQRCAVLCSTPISLQCSKHQGRAVSSLIHRPGPVRRRPERGGVLEPVWSANTAENGDEWFGGGSASVEQSGDLELGALVAKVHEALRHGVLRC